MLQTAIAVVVVLLVAGLLTVPAVRNLTAREVRWVQAAFVAHIAACAVQLMIVMIMLQGQADYVNFHRNGAMIAEAIRIDFWGVAPRSVLMVLQQDVMLNMPLPLEAKGGSSTASMWAIAAWGHLILGPSLVPTSLAIAMFSFGGKLALFRALRPEFHSAMRVRVLASTMLVPSVVFWTSGMIKEGVALGGLGFVVYGLAVAWREPWTRALPWLAIGAPFLLVKSYLLLPLTVASATYVYVARASRGGTFRLRPATLVLAGVGGVLGLLAIGEVFPRFSITSLGDSAAQMQFYGTRAGGGSAYQLGDHTERSLLGQLQYAPLAVLTAVFRPTLFEVRSPPMLLSAIETTGMAGIVLWLVLRQGVRRALAVVVRSPAMAFCVAFWVPTALGVGLISNSLGTLSRYRVPMLPFLVLTAVVVQAGVMQAAADARRKKKAVRGAVHQRQLS